MSDPRTTRTLVMTGATSGIGAHAVARLAGSSGTRVLIGARAGAPAAAEGVEVLPLELASLAEVREFAAAVVDRLAGEPIEVLVLNAGTQVADTSARSREGFELTFAVNHLAHYLLARLLLPSVADSGRIVLTTSDTHDPSLFRGAPAQLDLEAWTSGTGSPLGAYSASKLGNLLTAQGLAALPEITERRITIIAYNPGLTGGTGLQRAFPAFVRQAMRALSPVFALLGRFLPQLHMGTPERAGEALAQLADGTLTPPGGRVYASLVRGELTFPDPSELARDPRARDELWRASADLTGLPVR